MSLIKSNINEFVDDLDYIRNKSLAPENVLKIIAPRVINRSLITARKFISDEIRSTYFVSANEVKNRVRLTNANRSKPTGSLDYRFKKSLFLSDFGAVQNTRSVSVRVLRENRRRRIMPGGSKEILEGRTKRGKGNNRARVWLGVDKKGRKQIFALTKTSPDSPRILFGPSFMNYFEKDENEQRINTVLDYNLSKNFSNEMRAFAQGFFKNRAGSANRRGRSVN